MIGNIKKMQTMLGDAAKNQPVQYQLPIGEDLLPMNEHIGQTIKLSYKSEIHCVACGRKTNKSFAQGHCFPCFRSLASCDMCIMKPETCHYAAGTCREPEWGESHCFKPHFVYLANSSGIKVGITRGTQIPTRWMDQGAASALPIYKTKNRLLCGLVEASFKKHVNDKTSWQKMLKGLPEEIDLAKRRDELFTQFKSDIAAIKKEHGDDSVIELTNEETLTFNFPVSTYPEKVKSLNFDKTHEIEGVLQGIKGQYLILDIGVLNIRKFGGYLVEFSG